MTQLQWDETMSVGNEEIDGQHRRLLGAINDLYKAIMEGTFTTVQGARGKALSDLDDYISLHFSTEEKHMEKMGFPGLPEHRKLHREFAAQVVRCKNDISGGDFVLTSDILKTMLKWFRDHFLTEDRKYASFTGSGGNCDGLRDPSRR